MGADLAEGQDAGLGKGGRAAAAARAAEDAGVGQAVRDIDDEAVQGHQPQPLIEGPRGLGRGLEFDHLLRRWSKGAAPSRWRASQKVERPGVPWRRKGCNHLKTWR